MSVSAASPSVNVIEVRLRELAQLFNLMDPSPFHERELDADAEEFVVSWAREMPEDEPLSLLVHLDRPPQEPNPQAVITDAVHHYFEYRAEITRRRLVQVTREGRHDLARGMLFLVACMGIAELLTAVDWPPVEIFRESLLIPGWVAMWRPMELFLYERWPLVSERELYRKLAVMPVTVRLRTDG